jgi:hypothetical protein
MTKYSARLLPVAIVITSVIASVGGWYSGH